MSDDTDRPGSDPGDAESQPPRPNLPETLATLDAIIGDLVTVRAFVERANDPTAKLVAPDGRRAGFGLSEAAEVAKRELAFRRTRNKGSNIAFLLGEPSWELLLDLLVHRAERRAVSVTSACLASGAPTSTALRYIAALEAAGLVTRRASDTDRRVVFVSLTDAAIAWMVAALRER